MEVQTENLNMDESDMCNFEGYMVGIMSPLICWDL